MTAVGRDSLQTRTDLNVGVARPIPIIRSTRPRRSSATSTRLPFSMKVLLENLLRFEDGKTVTARTSRRWSTGRRTRPARRARSSIGRRAC